MSEDIDAPRLAERIERIEEIVGALEQQELELEDALTLFEEGIGHLKAAQRIVRESEMRIERLLEDEDGGSILEPMQPLDT